MYLGMGEDPMAAAAPVFNLFLQPYWPPSLICRRVKAVDGSIFRDVENLQR